LNGEKKWITNGIFADYFTVACRTGGPGAGGISLLLVERGPGVTTKQMNCMGVWSSGTTYITFEDVLVPCENIIGQENEGFKYIMCAFCFALSARVCWRVLVCGDGLPSEAFSARCLLHVGTTSTRSAWASCTRRCASRAYASRSPSYTLTPAKPLASA
jgi:hypothetical protein